LQTQQQMNNLQAQNCEQDFPGTVSNNKRKVTRLKGEKKASRNATQSLLEHTSFKSKNSNQNTTRQQAASNKVNTQKLNFPKHAIGKNKLVNANNANEHVSHSTVISASNMRSKSQKKKDLFANLIAEAQDSFAKYSNPTQTMTLQQTESQKIKKMHSTSNLQQPV